MVDLHAAESVPYRRENVQYYGGGFRINPQAVPMTACWILHRR